MADQITRNEKLYVLDPDLPILASDAAIALDDLLHKRHCNFKSVLSLAERLQKSFTIIPSNGQRSSLLDPATLAVLGEAINKSGPRVTKIEDLIDKAFLIADVLMTKTNTSGNRKELEWARSFCVALSRLTSAYHKSVYDMRPSHPFRR